MLDLSVIILTYNEEIHIRRCLDNVSPIATKVFIIDSYSSDKTLEIAKEYKNVEILQNKWENNHAKQFNWGLEHAPIHTEWILRIDADEYFTPELVKELNEKLPMISSDITGIEFKRRHIFMGRWVKHGIYPVIMMRMCRAGCGKYADRIMDEHMVLTSGKSIVFDHDFCDHSLINISDFCRKHIGYAQREAAVVLDEQYSLSSDNVKEGMSDLSSDEKLGGQAEQKHKKKNLYNKLPLFFRAFLYFVIRYFVKGGFLDGKEGFLFAFIQGWWYRTLVDAKILEVKKACHITKENVDKEEIRNYIKINWNIIL